MTLRAVIQEFKRLPPNKQAYISRIITRLKSRKHAARETPKESLWNALDAAIFSSGHGRLSERVEEFTGRRY